MPTRLRQLRIHAVALCQKGANPEAAVLLYKSADVQKQEDEDGRQAPMTTGEIAGQQAAMEQLYKLKQALMESCNRIFEYASLDAQPDLLVRSVQEFATLARQALEQINGMTKAAPLIEELEAIAKTGRKISAGRMLRLREIMSQLEAIMMEGDDSMSKELEAKVADLTKQLKTLTAANTSLKADLEKHAAQEPEDIWKNVHPDVKKQFETMQAKTAEAEAIAKAERDAREKQECIQKATSYKALPVNPDDDWEVFKDLKSLPETSRQRLEQLLKAAEEMAKQSKLFQAHGVEGSDNGSSSAYAKIQAKAQELVTKGDAPTVQQAIALVIEREPSLYHAYRQEGM